jgi:hypothetical protein
MEPSDGSSPDGKSMTYGDDILTHWKHPMAVSTKTEASGGSEYKILNRPPLTLPRSVCKHTNHIRSSITRHLLSA